MLLLLIIPVWTACLLVVAGLCAGARLGDSALPDGIATERREPAALDPLTALRTGPQDAARAEPARELAA
jgi:hypothetical protein